MDRNNHVKRKVQPKTCHEGREGEYRYNFTPSLTWALDGVGRQRLSSAALPPGKRFGAQWIGVLSGPHGRCGRSRPHWCSNSEPSSQ